MTNPDLAREIAELLTCNDPLTCGQRVRTLNPDARKCHTCSTTHPAILAWAERKLAEARAEIDVLRKEREYRFADLEAARADSELLEKVERALVSHDHLTFHAWVDGYSVTTGVGTSRARLAPNLADALRKLVGEES